MQSIVDEAVAAYQRDLFWVSFETGYSELADDPDRWASIEAERAVEDHALHDGDR